MRIRDNGGCGIYADWIKNETRKGYVVEAHYFIEAHTEEEAEDIAIEIEYFIAVELSRKLKELK